MSQPPSIQFTTVVDETSVRTFVKWCNFHLANVDDRVDNLATDLRDGKRLLKLLEVISGERLPKPERAGMRIHLIQNVAKSLNFLEAKLGEPLANCSAEDIVDGNVKLTLALLYQIMRFQLQNVYENRNNNSGHSDDESPRSDSAEDPTITDSTVLSTPLSRPSHSLKNPSTGANSSSADTKASILAWCNGQIENYVTRGYVQPVMDFHKSWKSGLAFSALLHRHDRYLLPDFPQMAKELSSNPASPDRWKFIVKKAFDVAEKYLSIPQILDPEDLTDVQKPDEKVVLACLSGWYSILSKIQRTPEWQEMDRIRQHEEDPLGTTQEGLQEWHKCQIQRQLKEKERTAAKAISSASKSPEKVKHSGLDDKSTEPKRVGNESEIKITVLEPAKERRFDAIQVKPIEPEKIRVEKDNKEGSDAIDSNTEEVEKNEPREERTRTDMKNELEANLLKELEEANLLWREQEDQKRSEQNEQERKLREQEDGKRRQLQEHERHRREGEQKQKREEEDRKQLLLKEKQSRLQEEDKVGLRQSPENQRAPQEERVRLSSQEQMQEERQQEQDKQQEVERVQLHKVDNEFTQTLLSEPDAKQIRLRGEVENRPEDTERIREERLRKERERKEARQKGVNRKAELERLTAERKRLQAEQAKALLEEAAAVRKQAAEECLRKNEMERREYAQKTDDITSWLRVAKDISSECQAVVTRADALLNSGNGATDVKETLTIQDEIDGFFDIIQVVISEGKDVLGYSEHSTPFPLYDTAAENAILQMEVLQDLESSNLALLKRLKEPPTVYTKTNSSAIPETAEISTSLADSQVQLEGDFRDTSAKDANLTLRRNVVTTTTSSPSFPISPSDWTPSADSPPSTKTTLSKAGAPAGPRPFLSPPHYATTRPIYLAPKKKNKSVLSWVEKNVQKVKKGSGI